MTLTKAKRLFQVKQKQRTHNLAASKGQATLVQEQSLPVRGRAALRCVLSPVSRLCPRAEPRLRFREQTTRKWQPGWVEGGAFRSRWGCAPWGPEGIPLAWAPPTRGRQREAAGEAPRLRVPRLRHRTKRVNGFCKLSSVVTYGHQAAHSQPQTTSHSSRVCQKLSHPTASLQRWPLSRILLWMFPVIFFFISCNWIFKGIS